MSKNNTVIGKLLDDLTNLEINTIIKKGMTSAPQPEEIEEVLQVLLSDYSEKLGVILLHNQLSDLFKVTGIVSYEDLYTTLNRMNLYMDNMDVWLNEEDYVIFLRMKSFCNYLWSRSKDIKFLSKNGLKDDVTVFTVNMNDFSKFKLNMDSRDRVMIKRLYDLGTERIVMQTRFGIDGDVVTRIEENFANRPKQIVIDSHNKHTDLSVKYWQSLVNVVISIVGGRGK